MWIIKKCNSRSHSSGRCPGGHNKVSGSRHQRVDEVVEEVFGHRGANALHNRLRNTEVIRKGLVFTLSQKLPAVVLRVITTLDDLPVVLSQRAPRRRHPGEGPVEPADIEIAAGLREASFARFGHQLQLEIHRVHFGRLPLEQMWKSAAFVGKADVGRLEDEAVHFVGHLSGEVTVQNLKEKLLHDCQFARFSWQGGGTIG